MNNLEKLRKRKERNLRKAAEADGAQYEMLIGLAAADEKRIRQIESVCYSGPKPQKETR